MYFMITSCWQGSIHIAIVLYGDIKYLNNIKSLETGLAVTDDIYKYILLNENVNISIEISNEIYSQGSK